MVTITAGTNQASFQYSDTAAGVPTVTASATGLTSATQDQTINVAALATLTVTPDAATLTADDDQDFDVTGVDQFNNSVTELGTITWSVNGGIGTINEITGLLEATTVGSGSVTATSSLGISDDSGDVTVSSGKLASLEVSPNAANLTADDVQQFTLTGKDAHDNPVTELGTITWSISVPIGTIDDNGLLTATTVGKGNVTATSSIDLVNVTSGTIRVDPGVLAGLTVSAASSTLTADQTLQFSASGRDGDNNNVNVDADGAAIADSASTGKGTLAWGVNGGIGTVSNSGLFDATTAGIGSVTATSSIGNVSGTSGDVTVTPGAIASLEISTDRTKVASEGKGTANLTTTYKDGDGNTVDDNGTTITFTVTGDGTSFAAWTSETDTTASGLAQVAFTTAGGAVPDPGTTSVNVQASGGGFNSTLLALDIVNFSATPNFTALVTSGTPHEAVITPVGATNYMWTIVSGPGTLSSATTTGDQTVTFTAPASITGGTSGDKTTIKVADTDNPGVEYDFDITTYDPVQVVQPSQNVGITHNGNVTTYQVQITGGTGAYQYAINGAAGVLSIDTAGLVTGQAVGTRTLYAWDATLGAQGTDNSFRTETAQIEVVDGITIDPSSFNLQSTETKQFNSSGGTAAFNWSLDNTGAGSIAQTGLFTAATVSALQTATITAQDGTYPNVEGTATVNVYATLISDAPAIPPVIDSGDSTAFNVTGGDGNYTWSATGPDGGNVSAGVLSALSGANVSFTPLATNYAGEYTIKVVDGLAREISWKVIVPLGAVTMTYGPNVLESDTTNGIIFNVQGADTGIVWMIVNVNRNLFAGAGTLDGDQDADTKFTPADVGSITPFWVLARKGDLLRTASMSKVARVIPVETYCGRITDKDGVGLNGIELSVINKANLPTTSDTTANDGTSDGAFDIDLPTIGSVFRILVADPTEGYLPEVVNSRLIGTTCNFTLALEAIADIVDIYLIAGKVSSGGMAVDGAQVAAYYVNDNGIKVFTDPVITDFNGNYLIELPAGWPSPFNGDADFDPDFVVGTTAKGYQPNKADVEENVGPGRGRANIALTAAPPPVFAQTKLKVTDSVDSGVVTVSIATPVTPQFDGMSADEILVELVPGTGDAANLGPTVWDGGTQAYLVDYNDASQSFSLRIVADAQDHDVTDGDKVTMRYDYVAAYAGAVMDSSDPVEMDKELGGTGSDGTTEILVNPGALDEEALDDVAADKIVVQITQVDITNVQNKGAVQGSGDLLFDIDLKAYDNAGDEVGTSDETDFIRGFILVSLPFDTGVVPPGGFESGAFLIRHAKTATELFQGGGTVVPVSDIESTDYLGGIVVVRISSLSVFGVGAAPAPTSTALPTGGGGGGGCFIATAAYGSLFEPHVKILRDFRDLYLLPSKLGRKFVTFYYRYSPPVAEWIAGNSALRATVRIALVPLVGLSYLMLHTGVFGKMAVLAITALLLYGVAFAARRRRALNGG